MSQEKLTKICHYLSALVLAIILICQFTPFWTFTAEEGETSLSISSYIWFPTENKAADSYISANAGEGYNINQLVVPSVLVLFLSAAGMILCLIKSGEQWMGLFPLGCGLAGLWGFLTKAGFQLGTAWELHVALYVIVLALGAAALYYAFKKEKAA